MNKPKSWKIVKFTLVAMVCISSLLGGTKAQGAGLQNAKSDHDIKYFQDKIDGEIILKFLKDNEGKNNAAALKVASILAGTWMTDETKSKTIFAGIKKDNEQGIFGFNSKQHLNKGISIVALCKQTIQDPLYYSISDINGDSASLSLYREFKAVPKVVVAKVLRKKTSTKIGTVTVNGKKVSTHTAVVQVQLTGIKKNEGQYKTNPTVWMANVGTVTAQLTEDRSSPQTN